MKVWISRDKSMGVGSRIVDIWKGKPEIDGNCFFGTGKDCIAPADMDVKQFKALLGFTPRKGTCKEYNLTLEEVK